jgi:hypothetical protein
MFAVVASNAEATTQTNGLLKGKVTLATWIALVTPVIVLVSFSYSNLFF